MMQEMRAAKWSMRRTVALGVSLLLAVVSLVPLGRGDRALAAATSPATVTVTPNITGLNARYVVTFTTYTQINVNDPFIVHFPAGTYVPCTPCHNQVSASSIRVNGAILPEDAMGSRDAAYIYFKSPVVVPANNTVTVEFSPETNILNPQKADAAYTVSVESVSQGDTVVSLPYSIQDSKLTGVSVDVNPRTSGAPCTVSVSFTTGLKGAFTTENRGIQITFPATFAMPLFVSPSMVTVNGVKPSSVITNSTQVRVVPSQAIDALTPVVIAFSVDAGIKTPVSTGQVTFVLSTDAEPTPVTVVTSITEVPAIATAVSTNPLQPDGQNGWFVSPVIVVLNAVSNAPGALVTHWSLDGGPSQIYSGPFSVPDGVHQVLYHSVNTTLGVVEKDQTRLIQVESADPTLSLDSFTEGGYVRTNPWRISGTFVSVSKGSLVIAGKSVYLDPSRRFDQEVDLVEGNNIISVDLTTESGKARHMDLNVVLDTVPPQFTISSPSSFAIVRSPDLTVHGSVERGASLTYAGQPVAVAEDGTFDSAVVCAKEGLNVFSFTARDAAGNSTVRNLALTYTPQQASTTTISLVIGSTVAEVDGKTVLLEAAPFIDRTSGRTLVPLRFIGESLGASVAWDGASRTVSITLDTSTVSLQVGNMQALVNGSVVALEQPPVIVSGRTFVPLRFISEALGAAISWNADKQQVGVSLTRVQ